MAPSLVFFLLAYATIGTWLTTAVFGKRLMQLQFSQLQKEGDLRFDLVRARENSGAVPSGYQNDYISPEGSCQEGVKLRHNFWLHQHFLGTAGAHFLGMMMTGIWWCRVNRVL